MNTEVVREPSRPGTAGGLLAAAREGAGLSIDAVAQQLKLAPRQVRALEEDDYTHLPGRTFVRGFVRNYARLLHLDPDVVLGALPAGAVAPSLEAPELQQTAPTIGELPYTDHSRPGWTRWAIPVTLAAIIAAAAAYEWWRPGRDAPAAGGKEPQAAATPAPARSETAGTSLPNPFAASGAPTTAAAPASGPAVAEQTLVITYRDNSWTEVRDQTGRVLLSRMNPAGSSQTLSGTPPFELVIGNAADVSLIYAGRSVDLAPYTRQNVARLTLP